MVFHEYGNFFLFFKVRGGLVALNQKTLGCTTIVQGALPKILTKQSEKFYTETINLIQVI